MKAHAVVFTAPGKVEFRAVECPEPGPEDVVIELTHSWISNGTEGSFLRGERLAGDTARRTGDPSPFPIIAGYQKVGMVTAVGAAVRDHHVGDRVFAVMSQVEGMFDRHAGHVSPSVCHQSFVHRLPDGGASEDYSGMVLTQVGYNCGTRPRIEPGELAVVVGDGLVGQWTGQTLKQRGARVIMTGRHEDRLAKFTEGGWGQAIKVTGDGAAEIAALGLGEVAVMVDTVGDARLFDAYLPLMQHGGTMVSAGFYGTADAIEIQRFRYREIAFDLVAGITAPRVDATIQWVAEGKLDTAGLITHRFPVEAAAEAWALIESKREPVLGVILEWKART
ncbi:zinc-binding dehydrogenase [Synoicihabitans lomoniglobus]|uniref:Zinc-binding dehydrogenase n=1 Tax=Synoicihabitans lomoniglobus TaxID=2909285 RepID=A0AAF0CRV8_9BACT|nr:zinc-binding dehydrogenase [Opitutaceae bacterium LMO-M01]WED66954.1 zinc-binding dehydrogenase [Opitutaceae bacterium LMO-M01]